jgi:DNA polymerase III epsilon subunit-like protein
MDSCQAQCSRMLQSRAMPNDKCFICVDIETAGPNPTEFSMLSIGAALVDDPEQSFYIELQPFNGNHEPESDRIHGLSIMQLLDKGIEPKTAMQQFADWVSEVAEGRKPVFVAFNAPFDWMFVNDYFHSYLDRNPFGHRALDIKAVYMGMHGVDWEETTYDKVSRHYRLPQALSHNAEQDARQGAELFAAMLAELAERTQA